MAIDWTGLRTAVRACALAATGLNDGHVIWAFQNGPRPLVPFIEINPRLAIARVGSHDEETMNAANADQLDRKAQRRVTVSCHAFGPDAFALLEAMQAFCDTEAGHVLFDVAGLAVADFGSVNDLTELLETQFEERAQFDLIFALAAVSSEKVGAITSVGLAGTIQNPDTTPAAQTTQVIGP
jgi:hypothetical protein